MEIRLEQWINRPDYLEIVQAVKCEVCKVPEGIPCRNRTNLSRNLNSNSPRSEPHQDRVWEGIEKYILEKQNATSE